MKLHNDLETNNTKNITHWQKLIELLIHFINAVNLFFGTPLCNLNLSKFRFYTD